MTPKTSHGGCESSLYGLGPTLGVNDARGAVQPGYRMRLAARTAVVWFLLPHLFLARGEGKIAASRADFGTFILGKRMAVY